MLQTSEIQVIIGDSSRDGVGGRQYCGVWSLTSKHRPFNAFGNSYAGLLPGELRGQAKTPVFRRADERTCVLSHTADDAHPVDVRAEYRVSEPYYIDHTLSLVDRKHMCREGCDFREVSWCCYMNCPDDLRLHFLSGGEWFAYISPEHGIGSNIAPACVPDDRLEVWPPRQKSAGGSFHPFHWDRIERRFDEPFYYGRLANMVLILVFDKPEWLRFFCSPSGGGNSLRPGQTCPAWDFEWVIPKADYQAGKEYTFNVRLAYKPFVSEDDVLAEYHRARTELGTR
jgi:hypothetical protein